MKINRTQSVTEYKLVSSFEALRKKLLSSGYADRLEHPLAFWALPNDRRLPLALLGRNLRDLLGSSFEELYATPGIGQKKIASLVELLGRAVAEPPGTLLSPDGQMDGEAEAPRPGEPGFEPAAVSESQWIRWRAAVIRHGLENEPLGRFAATLEDLPRVVWTTPLKTYLAHSLSEIRSLRTHGEKRVRVVVEIFGALYTLLGDNPPPEHLSMRIAPKFVQPLEAWISGVLGQDKAPSADEIRRSFVQPLLDQVQVDAGDPILSLAESRLGFNDNASTVRQVAKSMRLTRARVYQLLNDISDIFAVRWPDGRRLVGELQNRISATGRSDDLELFYAAVELFFPSRRPVEPARVNRGQSLLVGTGRRQAG